MENKPDGISVLVVDDEQDLRDGSERILTRAGFHVLKASRGDEALELLPKQKVSIVLLDLKMPGMDGMEVLKHIRALDETILVIVITGYATVETAVEAKFQDYFVAAMAIPNKSDPFSKLFARLKKPAPRSAPADSGQRRRRRRERAS